MNYHKLLNLIMLVTIIGLAIFLYLRPLSDADTDHRVSEQTVDAVQHIRIVRDKAEIVLKKHRGRWNIEQPIKVVADQEKINQILEVLSASSQQQFVLSEQAQFGLDQPIAELYIDQQYFGFGGLAPTTNQQYLATNQNIYLVSPRYAVFLPSDPLELVSKQLLAENEVPIQFETQNWRAFLQDSTWQVLSSETDHALSSQELDRWRQLWHSLQASRIAFQAQTDTGKGENQITVGLQDGRTLVLTWFETDSELVLLRSDTQIGYHFPSAVGKRLLRPADHTVKH